MWLDRRGGARHCRARRASRNRRNSTRTVPFIPRAWQRKSAGHDCRRYSASPAKRRQAAYLSLAACPSPLLENPSRGRAISTSLEQATLTVVALAISRILKPYQYQSSRVIHCAGRECPRLVGTPPSRGEPVRYSVTIGAGEWHRRLAACKRQKAKLVIAKLDCLSRNLAFIARLIDSGVEFVAVDNPHTNKMALQILAVFAEHEREIISERTKAALAAAKIKRRGGERIRPIGPWPSWRRSAGCSYWRCRPCPPRKVPDAWARRWPAARRRGDTWRSARCR
jgi:hypothetical protein